MRVAYVCADRGIPVFGSKGASIHVQEILRSFLRRGDEIDLLAARLGGAPPPDLAGLRIHPLEAFASSAGGGKRSRIDLDAALRRALVETDHDWSLVYERHALWSSAAMRFARTREIPGILEVNAPLVREQARHRRLEDPELARRLANESLRSASLRVAVSRGVAANHDEYDLCEGDFLVCPNGVDPGRFPSCGPRGAERPGSGSARSFTVGFLGSLKPWHGLPVLVEAFALLAREEPRLRLLIAGDGPMRAEIEGRLAEIGLSDRSELMGSLPPAAVPAALARMDVGVAPYAEAEGHYFSPLKIFEYMAACRPVVASRVGQIPELMSEGVEGLMVEAGDAAALADALKRLASRPDLARRMGEAGRRRVIERHTWDAILERILREAFPNATTSSTPGARAAVPRPIGVA